VRVVESKCPDCFSLRQFLWSRQFGQVMHAAIWWLRDRGNQEMIWLFRAVLFWKRMELAMSDLANLCLRKIASMVVVAVASTSSLHAADVREKHEECPPTRQTYSAEELVSDLVRRNETILVGTVVSQLPSSSGEWRGVNRVFSVAVQDVLKGDEQLNAFELAGLESDSLYPIDPYVLSATSRHATVNENPERPPFGGTRQFKRVLPIGTTTCEYVPVLEVGMTYLMFLSRPYAHLSFEPIVDFGADDWLAHVRTVVTRQNGK
jgi:hypothetical protein